MAMTAMTAGKVGGVPEAQADQTGQPQLDLAKSSPLK